MIIQRAYWWWSMSSSFLWMPVLSFDVNYLLQYLLYYLIYWNITCPLKSTPLSAWVIGTTLFFSLGYY
jgi:hypothetical protein